MSELNLSTLYKSAEVSVYSSNAISNLMDLVHTAAKLKIAVATAIIKTKPQHMTGEEYAKQLCNQFVISQLSWKHKCESIETELIHAKQELILKDLQAQPTDDSQADAVSVLYPTPPPSMEETPAKTANHNASQRNLELHTNFLQGVAHLRSISRQVDYGQKLNSLTIATVIKSVGILQEALMLPENKSFPYKCLLHATETSAAVCVALTEKQWKDVSGHVESLLSTIVRQILVHDATNQNKFQEQLCELFITLAAVERLQGTSLDLLLSQLEEFSGDLRRLASRQTDMDPVVFENIYFILCLIERLLLNCTINSSGITDDVRRRFADRLDDCLLHLCDQFSLFARLMWRIGSLFVSIHSSQT